MGRVAIPRFARNDNEFAREDNRWTTRGAVAKLSGRTGRTPSAERAEPTCGVGGHNTFDLLSARRAGAGGAREEIAMTEPAPAATSAASLEQLRKQAKHLLRDFLRRRPLGHAVGVGSEEGAR